MSRRASSEYSRVLSDVSLVPERFGISIVWLSKIATVCIIILWFAIWDINYLPICIMIDTVVIVVAVIGRALTPSHLDSFGEYLWALIIERWGQDRLVTNPSYQNDE